MGNLGSTAATSDEGPDPPLTPAVQSQRARAYEDDNPPR